LGSLITLRTRKLKAEAAAVPEAASQDLVLNEKSPNTL
jgi:hypothetical protein